MNLANLENTDNEFERMQTPICPGTNTGTGIDRQAYGYGSGDHRQWLRCDSMPIFGILQKSSGRHMLAKGNKLPTPCHYHVRLADDAATGMLLDEEQLVRSLSNEREGKDRIPSASMRRLDPHFVSDLETGASSFVGISSLSQGRSLPLKEDCYFAKGS